MSLPNTNMTSFLSRLQRAVEATEYTKIQLELIRFTNGLRLGRFSANVPQLMYSYVLGY